MLKTLLGRCAGLGTSSRRARGHPVRGRATASALVAVCVLLLVGPGALAQTPSDLPAVDDDVLRVALNGFESNLTPFTLNFSTAPNTHDLLNLVYDSLFWSQVRQKPEPWLAASAKASPDSKKWTVKLRSGVNWHDGKPFTAEDVKFTFEYFRKHANLSGRYGHHIADFPLFERGEVIDETTVDLYFQTPAPTFKIVPGADLPILPKHLWETVEDPLRNDFETPIGTGPYRVTKIVRDESYRLRANEDYFKGEPLVKEMELKVIADSANAVSALISGEVDSVASSIPTATVTEVAQKSDLKVVKGTHYESIQLNFNARRAPTSDPVLRKAISLVIDPAVLVKEILKGAGKPGVDGFIHPDSPWAQPDAKHELDAARAKQMLEAAGYTKVDPDGVRRSPTGKRLEFSVLFSTFEPHHLRTLEMVFQMASQLGIRLNPEVIDPGDLRTRRRAPAGEVPDYDVYVSSLDAHSHTDPDALYFFFHSPGPKGIGGQITGYSNPEFDALTEQAAVTPDVKQRKALLAQMQTILGRDAPVIPLYYPDGIYAFRPSAYQRWFSDPGHGIFTKRSFLKDYAPQSLPGEDVGGINPAFIFLGAIAGIVVLGSAIVFFKSRRKKDADDEPETESPPPTPEPAEDEEPPATGEPPASDPEDDSNPAI